MKVKSIIFENYKSFMNKTHLKFDKGVTTVIGKNESGKSNLIELIGSISIDSSFDKAVFDKWNRARQDECFPITIRLEISKEEAKILNVNETESTIKLEKEASNPAFNGFLTEYFSTDLINSLFDDFDFPDESLNTKLNNAEIAKYRQTLDVVKLCQDKICYNFKNNIKTIDNLLKKAFKYPETEGKYETYHTRLENFQKYFEKMYKEFPYIYLHTDENLNNVYNMDKTFFDKYETQSQSIKNFISATELELSIFHDACNSANYGLREDRLEEIKEAIKDNIEEPFNKFYQQEKVSFKINIQGSKLRILVKTSNQSIELSERSDGLRWYFNLFLALKARNAENRTILFLIDEPGVHLHIDAQKYLVELFHELGKENQIVYTTHSPFMIEPDRLEQIRVITKNDGVSHLYNSIHDTNIEGVSKQETFSPIAKAIGLNMTSDFGLYKAPFSIITEGKLDVQYLCSFDPTLKRDFKFISCIGAPNIINVSTILLGWGCDFIILLDDDKEGRNTKEGLLKKGVPENIIIFANDHMKDDNSKKFEIENLISKEDYPILGYNYSNLKEDNKTQAAIRFREFMNSDEVKEISDETSENFTNLIDLLRSKRDYIKQQQI